MEDDTNPPWKGDLLKVSHTTWAVLAEGWIDTDPYKLGMEKGGMSQFINVRFSAPCTSQGPGVVVLPGALCELLV